MQGEASTRLGFTDYFRVELAWAKLLGAVLLLAPVPARLKEWAYAAFAITLGSALIAHLSRRRRPAEAWGWAAGTGRALGTLVLLWRRLMSNSTRCRCSVATASHGAILGAKFRYGSNYPLTAYIGSQLSSPPTRCCPSSRRAASIWSSHGDGEPPYTTTSFQQP